MLGWLELFLFAPSGGGWAYTYVQRPDLLSLLAVAGLVPLVAWLWWRTDRQIDARPLWVVAQWLVAALIIQWFIHAIAPFSLAAKLESVPANGFYSAAQAYPAGEFLRQFHSIAPTLPMHVQANLPGKVLFFHLLGAVSDEPAVLAVVVILLSTLGAGLVYLVTWQWCSHRRLAVVATVFYLVFPARILFQPLLNTVSPLLMLIALALVGAWAGSRAIVYAIALGPVLYLLALFDPLPLAAGLVGLAVLFRHRHAMGSTQLVQFSVVVATGLVLSHLAMIVVFGFDLIAAYRFAIGNAMTFNLDQQRPYWFWVWHNLKDFAIAIGVAQAMIVAFGARRWLAWASPIGLSVLACLLIVDSIGVNRGEVQRLWIFLGVLFQIVAAMAAVHDRRLTMAVIALSVAQTAIVMRSIAWVVP